MEFIRIDSNFRDDKISSLRKWRVAERPCCNAKSAKILIIIGE